MTDIYQQLDFVYRQLIDQAHEARKSSYCPYSGYAVGAALLSATGKIYLGSNIENASYTPTVCAERVAFFKAVSAGEREFVAIAVVGAPKDEEPTKICPPCGVCRQVMSEFCGSDFVVLLGNRSEYEIVPFSELMPHSFTKDNLTSSADELPEEDLEENSVEEYEEDSDEYLDDDSDEEYEEDLDEDYDEDLDDDSDEEYEEDLDDDYDDEPYADETDNLIDELSDEEDFTTEDFR